jgi:hypothetical protein
MASEAASTKAAALSSVSNVKQSISWSMIFSASGTAGSSVSASACAVLSSSTLCGENHIGSVVLGLHRSERKSLREGKGLMNAYSLMTMLLRPTNEGSAAFEVRQPILLPRTAADEL